MKRIIATKRDGVWKAHVDEGCLCLYAEGHGNTLEAALQDAETKLERKRVLVGQLPIGDDEMARIH